MWGFLSSALTVLFLAASVGAEERPQGLLWNRSGLAATLPLQVKTNAGADYLLHLRDVRSGESILAAYIRGGQFFRVLVPPGRYELLFSAGTDWQGEAALFGPATQRFELDAPLDFHAGMSRKDGHLIDLRAPQDISVRDFALCQWLMLDPESLRAGRPQTLAGKPFWQPDPFFLLPPRYPVVRYDLLTRVCD